MHRRLEPARTERHGFRAPGEDLDRIGQGQLPGDARLGVVIAANDKGLDARLVEPPELVGEKPRRLHRCLFAIVEVAGDHECVDVLRQAEIDNGDKGFSRRPADQLGQLGIAQRQRRERRIEVDVGGMNELQSHGPDRALDSGSGRSHRGRP